jgi:RNA polymerase-binding transcription factor DksA
MKNDKANEIAKIERRARVLSERVHRLYRLADKKRGICSNCGERFHVRPKLVDDGYVPGWLCAGKK